jgi:hypothetical protein
MKDKIHVTLQIIRAISILLFAVCFITGPVPKEQMAFFGMLTFTSIVGILLTSGIIWLIDKFFA